MSDNCPRPGTEEFEVAGSEHGMSLLQSVYHPHGHVGYNEKSDDLSTWLVFLVRLRLATPGSRIQNQHGLARSLYETDDFDDHASWHSVILLVVETNHRESAVDVHPCLSHHK